MPDHRRPELRPPVEVLRPGVLQHLGQHLPDAHGGQRRRDVDEFHDIGTQVRLARHDGCRRPLLDRVSPRARGRVPRTVRPSGQGVRRPVPGRAHPGVAAHAHRSRHRRRTGPARSSVRRDGHMDAARGANDARPDRARDPRIRTSPLRGGRVPHGPSPSGPRPEPAERPQPSAAARSRCRPRCRSRGGCRPEPRAGGEREALDRPGVTWPWRCVGPVGGRPALVPSDSLDTLRASTG